MIIDGFFLKRILIVFQSKTGYLTGEYTLCLNFQCINSRRAPSDSAKLASHTMGGPNNKHYPVFELAPSRTVLSFLLSFSPLFW